MAMDFLEERVGFEPTKRSSRSAVFKTAAFNRSATSPCSASSYSMAGLRALTDFSKAPNPPVVAVWLQFVGAWAFRRSSFLANRGGSLDLPQRVTSGRNGSLAGPATMWCKGLGSCSGPNDP